MMISANLGVMPRISNISFSIQIFYLRGKLEQPLEPVLRILEDTSWILGVKLLIITLLSLTMSMFPYRFQIFLSLIYRNRYISLYGADGRSFMFLSNLFMTAAQILTISLFIWQVQNSEFKITPQFIDYQWTYWNIFQIVAGYTILYIIIGRLPEIVFNEYKEEFSSYVFGRVSYINYASLFLLGFCLLFVDNFTPSEMVLKFFLGLFVITNILGFAFIIHWKKLKMRNVFHHILYLCAFELTPVLVIVKLII